MVAGKTTPTMSAQKRERLGSRYARRLRAQGKLPGVLYGHHEAPVAIAVDEKEMLTQLHHGQRVFKLTLDGQDELCLVKDLQFGVLGDDVIHVDFARVNLDEEVHIALGLKFIGVAKGLAEEGAVFRTVSDSIEVRCKATDIPTEEFEVDVTDLGAGEFITAGDLKLPGVFSLHDDPETVLARIAWVAEEVEEPAGEEGEEAEPEIISEHRGESEEGDEES